MIEIVDAGETMQWTEERNHVAMHDGLESS